MTRSIFERGVYMGDELRTRSARPGAYDTMALPSRMGNRLRLPGDLPEPIPAAPAMLAPAVRPHTEIREPIVAAPVPAPAPKRARAPERPASDSVREPYRPVEGSYPSRVIAALQAEGGHLTYEEVSARFDVLRKQCTPVFKIAVDKGALVRHCLPSGQFALALPGYVLPAEQPILEVMRREAEERAKPAKRRMATFSEVSAAHALLEQRKARLAVWQDYLRALEKRIQFEAAIGYLRPFVPPIDQLPAD